MIVDVVRFVAARLTDPTTGVNALLASVPMPAGDGALPAVAHVYNEMDDAVTALGPIDPTLVEDGPVLCVCYVGSAVADTDPRTGGGEAAVQVLVRYAAEQDDPQAYARVGWQTLRAAARALAAPGFGGAMANAATVAHRVTLRTPSRIAPYAPPPASAAEAFTPALLVTVPATDAWALGA